MLSCCLHLHPAAPPGATPPGRALADAQHRQVNPPPQEAAELHLISHLQSHAVFSRGLWSARLRFTFFFMIVMDAKRYLGPSITKKGTGLLSGDALVIKLAVHIR